MFIIHMNKHVQADDVLVTRVVNLTEEYATLLVPRASYESLSGAMNVGGVAGGRATASKTSGALRTQSLDRGGLRGWSQRRQTRGTRARSPAGAARMVDAEVNYNMNIMAECTSTE